MGRIAAPLVMYTVIALIGTVGGCRSDHDEALIDGHVRSAMPLPR